jgi:glycosyltransferase involved in cell wall biosynthesis
VKIVHVITALPADGAEMMLYRLIRASSQAGIQHTVISLSSEDTMAPRMREAGAQVRILGMKRGVPSPAMFGRLVTWLDELEPDVVQSWLYHGDLMGGLAVHVANGLRTLRGSGASRPLLVWGIHHTDLLSTGSSRMTRWVTKACALISSRVPDRIVCCGEAAMSSHVLGGYCARKMIVIPNGFELDVFGPLAGAREALRQSLNIDRDALVVGIVGRYHPVKDYGNFIAAMRIVLEALPRCHFVMAGQGLHPANRELGGMIDAAGIGNACHLLGPRDDPQVLLAGLDVFCLSSRSEGLPTVIGEAMACEIPCVATDVGDTARLIGDTGELVPPENPRALARALTAMLTLSVEERASRGVAARKRIQALFSMEASWQLYEQTYSQAIALLRRPALGRP